MKKRHLNKDRLKQIMKDKGIRMKDLLQFLGKNGISRKSAERYIYLNHPIPQDVLENIISPYLDISPLYLTGENDHLLTFKIWASSESVFNPIKTSMNANVHLRRYLFDYYAGYFIDNNRTYDFIKEIEKLPEDQNKAFYRYLQSMIDSTIVQLEGMSSEELDALLNKYKPITWAKSE